MGQRWLFFGFYRLRASTGFVFEKTAPDPILQAGGCPSGAFALKHPGSLWGFYRLTASAGFAFEKTGSDLYLHAGGLAPNSLETLLPVCVISHYEKESFSAVLNRAG